MYLRWKTHESKAMKMFSMISLTNLCSVATTSVFFSNGISSIMTCCTLVLPLRLAGCYSFPSRIVKVWLHSTDKQLELCVFREKKDLGWFQPISNDDGGITMTSWSERNFTLRNFIQIILQAYWKTLSHILNYVITLLF